MDSFHPNDNVVSLSTAPNPALAHIWANVLRGEGIHCRVVGDFLDAGIGDISGMQPANASVCAGQQRQRRSLGFPNFLCEFALRLIWRIRHAFHGPALFRLFSTCDAANVKNEAEQSPLGSCLL